MPRTRQPFADFFAIRPPIASGQVQRLEQGALRQRIQLACASSIHRNGCVSVVKVMASAVSASSWRFRGRGTQQTTNNNNHFFLTYPRHLPGALSRWPSRGPAHLQRATRKGAPSSGKLSRVFSSPSQAAAWQAAEEKLVS